MKIMNIKRSIAFVLALLLLATASFGLTAASAEVEPAAEAETPKIISQNVLYGGDFSLMFAVDASTVSGSTVTLSVYDEMPDDTSVAIWQKTIDSASEKTTVKDTPCYVFITAGVAAKDMDKNYYIVAESAGKKSEVKKYSVAEYLYERLYGNGVAFGSSALEIAQTKLYLSVLQVGKNAQILLFNYDADPTNDRTSFVTDLCYVTVADGGTVNGAKSALVNKGEKVQLDSETIVFNKKNYSVGEWNVASAVDGEIVDSSMLVGSTVTPESHLIISAGRLLEEWSEPEAEGFEGDTSLNTAFISPSGFSSTDFITNGDDAELKLTFSTTADRTVYFKPTNVDSTKTAIKAVFEADMKLDNFVNTANASDLTNALNLYIYSNGNSVLVYTFHYDADGMRCYDSWGNWYAYVSKNPEHSVHIRLEYVLTEDANGNAVLAPMLYIDGELKKAATVPSKSVDSVKGVDTFNYFRITSNPKFTGEYTFDNVKTFIQYEPGSLDLSDYDTFTGVSAVDTSKYSSAPAGVLSMADGALKLDFIKANQQTESVTFKPQKEEANADKIVFELAIEDHYAINQNASVGIDFYAGSTLVYDFRLNNGKLLTAEANSVSWGISVVPGETNVIRFELYMNGNDLVIDAYINNVKAKAPANYGAHASVHVKGVGADYLDKINSVRLMDEANFDGYYLIDNVRFSKLNTSN